MTVSLHTLPGSSGVFKTDGSTTDVARTPTGVSVAELMTDFLFLSFAGVLYISEMPETTSYNISKHSNEQTFTFIRSNEGFNTSQVLIHFHVPLDNSCIGDHSWCCTSWKYNLLVVSSTHNNGDR